MSFKDIFKKSFLNGYAGTEIDLVTIVVALAIAFPTIKEWFAFQKKKAAMQKGGR